LCWGGRVPKDHLRVEAYGTLDELCAFLGLAKSLIRERKTKNIIECLQKDLFVICAELATKSAFLRKLKRRINKIDVSRLERIILDLEKKRTFKQPCFYLPGENIISSNLDIARTIARRAERHTVSLKRKGLLLNPSIIVYLNRLSDLLYLLARAYEKKPKKLKSAR